MLYQFKLHHALQAKPDTFKGFHLKSGAVRLYKSHDPDFTKQHIMPIRFIININITYFDK